MRGLQAISEWSGRLLSWFTLLMVAVTFVVVVLRYGFGMGWIAMQESVLWMHGLALMLGSAYTLRHDAHVRVDVFYRLFDARTRALVDLLGTLVLLFPVCAFILWSSWGYVADSWSVGESSREAGGLPALYLLKTVIPAAAVLLTIEGITLAVRSWQTIANPVRASQKRSHGLEEDGGGAAPGNSNNHRGSGPMGRES